MPIVIEGSVDGWERRSTSVRHCSERGLPGACGAAV